MDRDDGARTARRPSRQRVEGLIEGLPRRARHVGERRHLRARRLRPAPGRHRHRDVRAREGPLDPRAARERARRAAGRARARRRRHLRRRRGHRRADRSRPRSTRCPTARTNIDTEEPSAERPASGCSRRRARPPGAVTTSATPPPSARCSTTCAPSYGPEFAAVLDTARVWVNGDEPARRRRSPSSTTATRSPSSHPSAAASRHRREHASKSSALSRATSTHGTAE